MTLDQLNYFTRICELGSMTKASKDLFISQQALSLSVRNLEEEFDTILLYRSRKGVSPTPQGKVFYKKAKDILCLCEHLKKSLA